MHRHLSLITLMHLQNRELRNAIEKHPGVVWKWRIVGAKFGAETKGTLARSPERKPVS